MNNTSSTRMNMRSIASDSPGIVKRSVIKDYLNSPSVFFSWMCDTQMSRASVILTHIIAILFVLVLLSVEQAPMLSLAAALTAAFLIKVFNTGKEADNEHNL